LSFLALVVGIIVVSLFLPIVDVVLNFDSPNPELGE